MAHEERHEIPGFQNLSDGGGNSGAATAPVSKDFLECAIFGSPAGCNPSYVKRDEKGEYRTCGVCAVYHKLAGLYGNPVEVNIYVNEHNIALGQQIKIQHNYMKKFNIGIAEQIKELQNAHVKNEIDSTKQIKLLIDDLDKK